MRFEFRILLFQTGNLTKAQELEELCDLPICGGRTEAFMSFWRLIAQRETQTPSMKTWSWLTNSISYDNEELSFK